jgi:hypothetical protein
MIGGSLLALGLMWIPVIQRIQQERDEFQLDSPPNLITSSVSEEPNSIGEIDPEIVEFLSTLPEPLGRREGWYQDPAHLYFARYFDGVQWTTSTSDAVDGDEGSEDSGAAVSVVGSPTEPIGSSGDLNEISLERLDRLVSYLDRGLISLDEFERLKHGNDQEPGNR